MSLEERQELLERAPATQLTMALKLRIPATHILILHKNKIYCKSSNYELLIDENHYSTIPTLTKLTKKMNLELLDKNASLISMKPLKLPTLEFKTPH